MIKIVSWKKLAVAIVIPQAVGILGALVTTPQIKTWYQTLDRPAFSPPNWVFGPVWTGLFVLMGIAMYLVWSKTEKVSEWYWGQLGLNLLWSILFFGLQSPGLALGEILVLWVAIWQTMVAFGKISKTAGYLLIPYLAWVSWATVLNASIWWLNFK